MAETASDGTRFDAVGIGNAIVDVLAHAPEALLTRLGLAKGAMTLIDAEAAEELYAQMGPGLECSGGSAANTVAGLASLGGRAAFIGKVKRDQLGQVFAHDIASIGVHFATPPLPQGAATARCLVFVTPDAQRTMQTYLGAAAELGPEDIDEAVVATAKVSYLEGYLWDPPRAKEAFLKAAEIAHAHDRKVALSLSDPFCVHRHRNEFRELVRDHVDILFANEQEIVALYQTPSFALALEALRGTCEVAALTRGAEGSVILAGDATHEVAAAPVKAVLDSTGAGDLYAAGFLHGLTQGRSLPNCGRLGSLAAAEVIGHLGARPETPLSELARQAGLA
jgi:sugar/nucleoside kinase (ribokinase family)